MNILIACGTGEVCSTIIRIKTEQLFAAHNYHPHIEQCKIMDIEKHLEDVDLLLIAMEVDQTYDVPTIVAQNYISEKDEELLNEELLNFMKMHYNK